MSTYVGYTLAFIVIGLFAGYASRTDIPDGSPATRPLRYAVAVAGALAGGILWLLLREYGWGGVVGGTQAGQGPEALGYANLAGDTTQPGYWIGLFFAVAGTIFTLAVYLLIAGREEDAP